MQARTVTGMGLRVYVDGAPFGRVSRVTWRTQTPTVTHRGLDTLLPVEIAHVAGATVSGTLDVYKTVRDGGAEAAGFTALWDDLSRVTYFSLMVRDRRIDTSILRVDKAVSTGQGWVYGKGLVTGSITFEGVSYSTEVQS